MNKKYDRNLSNHTSDGRQNTKKLEKQKYDIPIYPSRHVCNGTFKGKMIFLHLNIKHKSKTSSNYSKAVTF